MPSHMLAQRGTVPEILEFPLRAISGYEHARPHVSVCTEAADPDIHYPSFTSTRPLYGELHLDRQPYDPYAGQHLAFALDESEGTGTGYDRFVIDLNVDKDLRSDTLRHPADVPEGAIDDTDTIRKQVCFAPIRFSKAIDESQPYEMEVMPRFNDITSDCSAVYFIATEARAAEIHIEGHTIDARLINGSILSSHWDHSWTILQLHAQNTGHNLMGGYPFPSLLCMCRINNKLWSFSTNPQGDRLYAERYAGDYGTLTLGAGGRFIMNTKMAGTLQTMDHMITTVNETNRANPEWVKSYRLPVGDYTPDILGILYGPLYVEISNNYHSDNLSRIRTDPIVYGLKIRKDKPCVLDFRNKPEVLFTSPSQEASIKPGDTIDVRAVLIDPKLDLMIRDLKRKPQAAIPLRNAALLLSLPILIWLFFRNKRRFLYIPVCSGVGLCVLFVVMIEANNLFKGRNALSRYQQLTPTVTIRRAGGGVLASGTMPYG